MIGLWLATLATAATCPATLDEGHDSGAVLYVDKSERSLAWYEDGQLARRDGSPACFDIGLGFSPTGDKLREGDGRTPEGRYVVTYKNPASRFHLSLGVSYPNTEDARVGLANGVIDPATHERIVAAGDRPPQHTPMGGMIAIHGGGSTSDWTLGCIAVDNEVMDWLYSRARVGTAIVVRP